MSVPLGALNEREKAFVLAYLKSLNATRAAKEAGYSEASAGSIGHELLKKPEIAAALQQEFEARATRTKITADRVLTEIARVAFARMTDFAIWDAGSVALMGSDELDDDDSAAILEVSETRNERGSTTKIKLHPKMPALELLCRHLGILEKDGGLTDKGKMIVLRYSPEDQK